MVSPTRSADTAWRSRIISEDLEELNAMELDPDEMATSVPECQLGACKHRFTREACSEVIEAAGIPAQDTNGLADRDAAE